MDPALRHELEHHEELYSGFAQEHFAKPAVVAFREYLVRRIVRVAGLNADSRVLSMGCGIGDTERLLSAHVGWVHGFDLSPKGIDEARRTAPANVSYEVTSLEEFRWTGEPFDAAIAVFFLHHMAKDLAGALERVKSYLAPGGVLYAVDPSRYRLAGVVGRLVVPHLMKQYQTENEDPLARGEVQRALMQSGFEGTVGYFDFVSTPLGGLLPSWRWGYKASRALDEVLTRVPLLRRLGGNLEVVAKKR